MKTKVTFNRAILRVDFLSIVPHCFKIVSSSFLYIVPTTLNVCIFI